MPITQAKINEIMKDISSMEDYKALNQAMRQKFTELQSAATNSLSVGDQVTFTSRGGKTVQGRVTKINVKTVKVEAEGVRWSVSPSLLTKV